MFVHDVEVLSVHIEEEVDDIINEHQMKIIEKTLELSNANKELEVSKKLAEVNNAMADLKYNTEFQKLTLENKLAKEKLEKGEEIARIKEASATAAKTAEEKLQPIMDSIQKSELARKKEITDAELSAKKDKDNLNMIKQKAYTDAIKKVMESFSPELIASMTSSANAELLQTVTQAMSPYAIANGESIAEVTNKLLRGTSLEKLIEHFNNDEK
jgi:hypothetical protein